MKRCLVLLGLLLNPAVATAQVPPNADWRTLETEHFRVTFGPGLEDLARRAGASAEAAYSRLAEELAAAPRGKIDVVLTDFVDRSNGMATPIPSNRILLYARPPVDQIDLAFFSDWIDEVVVHELTHIFHVDATGGLGRPLRALFGRVPASWPFFPVAGTPNWSTEGLATYIESRYTGAGRVHGSYHDMVLRTAVLEGAFESIDRVSGTGPRWPGGARSYIYGSLFADHLARTYGPEVHARLVRGTASAWVPPALAFDRVAKKAIGASFSQAFDAWRDELTSRYGRLADSLRAAGLTSTERIGAGGYHAYHPRAGPDGRVAFAAYDGRNSPVNRVVDPTTGRVRDLSRRNGLGPVAWLPDGAILTAQVEFDGPYRLYSDLYRVDERGERRLTRGARLSEPDVAPDGRRVVAVQAVDGTNRLAIHDLDTGETRPLTPARPDVHWAFPRWSPDGTRIAVGRWRAGGLYDVVVLDTLGEVLHEATADRAVEMTPAWSPDGRYVLFSSDRSGVPNLYAYDLGARTAAAGLASGPALRQVTNLLTGAFHPDISPDGRWIYFTGYHADGFHIERIPYDPASWRDAPALDGKAAGPDAPPAPRPAGAPTFSEARPYSPWHSLLPRAWIPVVEGNRTTGLFWGGAIAGEDLVGRHAYSLHAVYQPFDGLFAGRLDYRYAGLGNPVLGVELSRSWDDHRLAARPADAPEARLLSSEDAIAVHATLRRARVRSSASLTVGGEWVAERRRLLDAPGYRPAYPGTDFAGAFARAGFANYRLNAFSISREDGISVAIGARRRWDLDPFATADGTTIDRSRDDLTAAAAGYRAFRGFGFANHVLALRASARMRTGPGAEPFGIGGASGDSQDGVVTRIGGPHRFLPVRGFEADDRWGTRGWSASLEYRFPLALVDRGHRLWPVYLDRLSGALFVDAGHAWCTARERRPDLFGACPAAGETPLVAAGAELALDFAVFFSVPLRLRAGVGVPIEGPRSDPAFHIRIGPSF
jgi:hypothetical protein